MPESCPRRLLRELGRTLVFLACLELYARLDDVLSWNAPFWGTYSEASLVVHDELGTRCRPNGKFQKWQLNSYGFRGKEPTQHKSAQTLRVLALGASETFGIYEDAGEEYPSQLQRILDNVYPGKFEVINGGCYGMSPPKIINNLRTWLYRLGPDIVVFYPSPQFYLDDVPPRIQGTPASPPLKFECRLSDKIGPVVKRILPAWVQTRLPEMLIERTIRQHGPNWAWSALPRERVQLFETHLKELVSVVQSIGARPILTTHASRFGRHLFPADREQLVSLHNQYPRASGEILLAFERIANETIRRVASQLGVSIIDVELQLGKSPTLFADYHHFSNSGASAMASAVAAELILLSLHPANDKQGSSPSQ